MPASTWRQAARRTYVRAGECTSINEGEQSCTAGASLQSSRRRRRRRPHVNVVSSRERAFTTTTTTTTTPIHNSTGLDHHLHACRAFASTPRLVTRDDRLIRSHSTTPTPTPTSSRRSSPGCRRRCRCRRPCRCRRRGMRAIQRSEVID